MVYYETESLTEYEKLQQKQNLEKSSTLSESDASVEVETQASKSDASRGLMSSLSLKQELNKNLSTENKSLQKQYDDLLALYEDLQRKIDDYKNYSEEGFQELEEEIENLEEYNQILMTEEKTKKSNEEGTSAKKSNEQEGENHEKDNETDDDEDEPDEDKDELSLTGVFAVVILCVCFILIYWKDSLEKITDDALKLALYTLYENLGILLLLSAFCTLLFYLDPFEDLKLDDIIYGLCLFSMIYAGTCIILLMICQGFLVTWRNFEAKLSDLEEYLKNQDKNLEDLPEALVKYFFTKQLFIKSPYLLSNFSLKRLNFSEYLGKCFGQTIHEHLSMTLLGYSVTLSIIVSYRALLLYTIPYESYLLLSLPITLGLLLLLILSKLASIIKKLTPEITPETLFSYKAEEVETLPKPSYLFGRIPSLASSPLTFLCIPVHPCKVTFSYLFTGAIPSRHALLFWFDSFGPVTLKYFLQGSFISLLLWLTLYFCSFINGSSSNPLLYISPFICFLDLFLLLPIILKLLTFCTSIEMMKKRNHLESALISSKIEKSQLARKIYRQLKMVFRGFYLKNKGQELTEFQKKFIEEIFQLYADEKLEIVHLDDVFALVGTEIEDDELRLFARECHPVRYKQDKEFKIGLDGLREAVEVLVKSQKFPPRKVVSLLLDNYFEERMGKGFEEVGIKELKEFFEEFRWHFNDSDIEEFLAHAAEVGLKDLPGYIQDSLECSFR
jgi:hypothetical protein